MGKVLAMAAVCALVSGCSGSSSSTLNQEGPDPDAPFPYPLDASLDTNVPPGCDELARVLVSALQSCNAGFEASDGCASGVLGDCERLVIPTAASLPFSHCQGTCDEFAAAVGLDAGK
jgi:hypothetical protein